jgi:hypothetical protein
MERCLWCFRLIGMSHGNQTYAPYDGQQEQSQCHGIPQALTRMAVCSRVQLLAVPVRGNGRSNASPGLRRWV